MKDLETSLNNLKTDYIDIYQFHNPSFCPKQRWYRFI
ncbi:MAG: aldo/keto reductase [Faecalibacillus faecis]